jgi:hypothetical protein
MKSSLFLVVPAIVTALNLCFALYIIHRHNILGTNHDNNTPLDDLLNENDYANRWHQPHEQEYHAPSSIMTTMMKLKNSESAKNVYADDISRRQQRQQQQPRQQHPTSPPTKWTLMRSSLAHK